MHKLGGKYDMPEYFNFFYVRAVGNGSLYVGPNYRTLEEEDERLEVITLAHKALKEAAVDVSRILRDEYYQEPGFFVNNKLERALEILHEIDNDY